MAIPLGSPKLSTARYCSIVILTLLAFAVPFAPVLNATQTESAVMKVRQLESGGAGFSCLVQLRSAATASAESNRPTGEGTVTQTVFVFGSVDLDTGSRMEPQAGADTADLSLTATASPEPVGQFGSLTYDIDVVNHGPSTVQDAVLHDSFLPFGISLGVVPITPRSTVRISIVRPVIEPPGSTITATVSISSGTTDPNPDDNSATLVSHVVATVVPSISLAVVEGKRLTVQGTNFADGAVIEINGKPVATRSDPPFQSLVAKKGGKQIAPGDTVVLTVVNPDGARSAPFLFRRPAQ